MTPKEKAINYVKERKIYSCGFYPDVWEDHLSKAIDIALKEQCEEYKYTIRENEEQSLRNKNYLLKQIREWLIKGHSKNSLSIPEFEKKFMQIINLR